MSSKIYSKSPLKEKSFELALKIVKLCAQIKTDKKAFILSDQLLRSGTNPGAMVREAVHAQSGKDFIHKLEIAQKESNETLYWLELLFETKLIDSKQYQSVYNLTIEVKRMIRSSIITRKKNLGLLK